MLLSYVVITYNTDHVFLKKCLDSILNQVHEQIELVIVDDGSTNNVQPMLSDYEFLDTRVKVIYQENQGAAVARNTGIEHSKGDWIAFVDSDDWISSKMAQKLNPLLDSDKDIIVFGHTDCRDKEEETHLHGNEEVILFDDKTHSEMQLAILKDAEALIKYPMFFGAVWNAVYRKEFLDSENIRFDSKLIRAQDALFNLNALEKANRIIYIRENFYFYRIHSFSICHKFSNKLYIYRDLIDAVNDFINNNHKDERFRKSYYKFGLIYILEIMKLNFFHIENPDTKRNRIIAFKNELNKQPYSQIMVEAPNIQLNLKQKLLVNLIRLRQYSLLDNMHKIYYYQKSK